MTQHKDPFYGHTPYSVLIMRMSALGDLLMALPALVALKNAYRRTRFFWAVDAPYKDLIEPLEAVDTVLPFDRRAVTRGLGTLESFWRAVGVIWDFILTLRRHCFTHAFVFQPLLRAGFFAFASGARVIVGPWRWAEGSFLLYNFRKRVNPNRHMVEQNLELLAGTRADLTPLKPDFPLFETDREPLRPFIEEHALTRGSYVALCPGSSQIGKQWTIAKYAALADHLAQEKGLRPVWVPGIGSRDAQLVEAIVAAMSTPALVAPVLELRPLAAFLADARLVVAPDTGPLHLANLVGAPVLGLFGPTDPALSGPYWKPGRTVRHPGSLTLPYRQLHRLETPDVSMEALALDAVLDVCDALLDETR